MVSTAKHGKGEELDRDPVCQPRSCPGALGEIMQPTKVLTEVRDVRVQGPNYNELERAEFLTDTVQKALAMARRYRLDRVSIPLEVAEELEQMMVDGLRTAKQLTSQQPRSQANCFHDKMRFPEHQYRCPDCGITLRELSARR